MRLSIDQGTTSTRAILYDDELNVLGTFQQEIKTLYPQEGYVEQDAKEIIDSVFICVKNVLDEKKLTLTDLKSISITNQRESIVAWNKFTGEPLYNCIVWQSLQSNAYCETLREINTLINDKTGLVVDPYFSATKIMWLRDNIGFDDSTIVGTIDSWIIYNLTNKQNHVTDYSNTSRTMLFNIYELSWDLELLEFMDISSSLLPDVLDSNAYFGECKIEGLEGSVPIKGVLGDQQASLYGHGCIEAGMAKVTYGTGCFILTNIGSSLEKAPEGMLKTIAWVLDGKVTYAFEASIFIGGSLIKWLRDNLGLINNVEESSDLIARDSSLQFIPTFQGVKTPKWNQSVKGALYGIELSTTHEDIIKASVEAIAMQVSYIMKNMQDEIMHLEVDGGVTHNLYLMQFQADILQAQINVSNNKEVTALGAANISYQYPIIKDTSSFYPQMPINHAKMRYDKWLKAYEHTIAYYNDYY